MSFRWSVSGGLEALGTMAGVRFDRLFTELDAIVTAYEEGGAVARAWFGDEISFGGPRWAAISYGHINCLGSELVFPEDSEVAHTPIYGSLAEGIKALRREVDFTTQGLFPFYLALWDQLKAAFPAHTIPFGGFGAEGPLTTAWLLRGHGFFTDIYDDPPQAKEYLRLVTESIIRYQKLMEKINGRPEVNTRSAGVADDAAAMLAPALWPAFVMPYLEAYFAGLTTGTRHAHIEDLHPTHLHYLDELGLVGFDPSISARLSPALILANCNVPFTWRFDEMLSARLTTAQTRQWVFEMAAQGAPAVRAGVWRNNCTAQGRDNIKAFMATAQEVAQLLAEGCAREALLSHV